MRREHPKAFATSIGIPALENCRLPAPGLKSHTVDWICFSPDRKYLFAACEVDSFNGKPTGEVASFRVAEGKLEQLSGQNSASKGTCHCAIDHTGRVLISADYGGGSAASFKVTDGKLSPLVWSEHYTVHGPNPDRQEAAHAHFASFSPDNRFAYVNDLGGDMIHIYTFSTETAELKNAGAYHSVPGAGPRTLHFHPNGHTAYCMNEMASSVDVLKWNKADGSLTRVDTVHLLPPNAPLPDPKGGATGKHRMRHGDYKGWPLRLFRQSRNRFPLQLQVRPCDRGAHADGAYEHRRKDSAQLHA